MMRRPSDQVALTSAYHPMRVRQTIADWLVTKRWRPGIPLGYAASWGRSSEVRLSLAYTFLEYWGKKFDK